VLIAGAATEIGRKQIEEVIVADVRVALEHACRQHEEARCAKAALQAVMVDERLLQRVQLVAVCQAFDGADLAAFRLHGTHEARATRFAVEQNRARAAHAMLAADMGSGLPAIVADRIDQRAAWIHPDRMAASVDGERNLALLAHATARSSARRVTVRARSRRY